MGVFDVFGNKKERHEKAYGRGVKDASGGWHDKAWHGFGHQMDDIFGKGSTEHRSYEAGYHSGKKRRQTSSSSGGYNPGDESARDVALKFCALLVIIGCIALYTSTNIFRNPNSHSTVNGGTSRRINANELKLRSGPGKNYSVLKVFTRGEEIISFNEQQAVDGYVWVRAQSPNGQLQGWIASKYLSK